MARRVGSAGVGLVTAAAVTVALAVVPLPATADPKPPSPTAPAHAAAGPVPATPRTWPAIAPASPRPVTASPVAGAAASVPTYGQVKYRPLLGKIRVGVLKKAGSGTHVLSIVPMYSKGPKPTKQQAVAYTRYTVNFWQKYLPGIKIKVIARNPVKVTGWGTCTSWNSNPVWDAAVRASAPMTGRTFGQHVAGWLPECGDTASGIASQRPGYGVIAVFGTVPEVLAHEFGHNLGLFHSDLLTCRADGKQTSLAASCTEDEYDDPFDMMGNDPLGFPLRVAGFWRTLLTGTSKNTKVLPTNKTSTVTFATGPTGRGTQTAILYTKTATVVFDHQPAVQSSWSSQFGPDAGAAGIQARVVTANGQGLIQFPSFLGNYSDGKALTLQPGDVWDIPGTRLRVVAASPQKMTVGPTPSKPATPPPAPRITAPTAGQVLDTTSQFTLAWDAVPGAVAYVVDFGGDLTRLTPQHTSLSLDVPYRPAKATVYAVNAAGARSSTTVTITPVSAEITVTPDPDVDITITPTQTATITWTVPPLVAATVVRWGVFVYDPAGTRTWITLPAATRTWTFTPADYGATDDTYNVELAAMNGPGEDDILSFVASWWITVTPG